MSMRAIGAYMAMHAHPFSSTAHILCLIRSTMMVSEMVKLKETENGPRAAQWLAKLIFQD